MSEGNKCRGCCVGKSWKQPNSSHQTCIFTARLSTLDLTGWRCPNFLYLLGKVTSQDETSQGETTWSWTWPKTVQIKITNKQSQPNQTKANKTNKQTIIHTHNNKQIKPEKNNTKPPKKRTKTIRKPVLLTGLKCRLYRSNEKSHLFLSSVRRHIFFFLIGRIYLYGWSLRDGKMITGYRVFQSCFKSQILDERVRKEGTQEVSQDERSSEKSQDCCSEERCCSSSRE